MTSASPEASATAQESQLRCPYCRSGNLRNSRMRTPLDFFLLVFLHHYIRCRACDYRFARWVWIKAPGRSADL